MPFSVDYDINESQVMMTLAALAYANETPNRDETISQQQVRIRNMIILQLQNPAYATNNEWVLTWGPGLDGDNMMYVAKRRGFDQYAVVIRGTDWGFFKDWIEDLAIFRLVTFPYIHQEKLPFGKRATDIQIAEGTQDGLQSLISLKGQVFLHPENTDAVEEHLPRKIGLVDYLMQLAKVTGNTLEIFVTGHSRGGCLPTVLAPWLHFEMEDVSVQFRVYTFAGPSAGNKDFADFYDEMFKGNSFRVYNNLDIVPTGWDGIAQVKLLFLPAPRCPWWLDFSVNALNVYLTLHGLNYTQPSSFVVLSGTVTQFGNSFISEVAHQHDKNTYLGLLGAAPVEITE